MAEKREQCTTDLLSLPHLSKGASWSSKRLQATNHNTIAKSLAPVGIGKMMQHQQRRTTRSPIKKAYVRFDDYLDLNEENMRRSCKKIMNKLYCEPGKASESTSQANSQTNIATTIQPDTSNRPQSVCRQQSPPPSPMQRLPGDASSNHSTGVDGCSALPHDRTVTIGDGSNSNEASQLAFSEQPAEKSYLRSQYERRQKRQLELLNKRERSAMQQDAPHMVMNSNMICGTSQGTGDLAAKFNQNDNGQIHGRHDGDSGASTNNICQEQRLQLLQQQQDSVAKSHELSKRRFFEKLERRESIRKNLEILNTQCGAQTASHSSGQRSNTNTAGLVLGVQSANESRKQIFQEPVKYRERTTAGLGKKSAIVSGDKVVEDSLPARVNQSITPASSIESPLIVNSARDNRLQGRTDCTHGMPTGSTVPYSMPPSTQQQKQPKLSLLARESPAPAGLSARPENLPPSLTTTNELIGFHTHLPATRLMLADNASATLPENNCATRLSSVGGGVQQSTLIEFSQCGQTVLCEEHSVDHSERCHGATKPLPLDKSAFEIKVPAESCDQSRGDNSAVRFTDCCLVVKQVDCQQDFRQAANSNEGRDDARTELSTKLRDEMAAECSNNTATRGNISWIAATDAATQFESNKMQSIGAPSSSRLSPAAGIDNAAGESSRNKREAASSSKKSNADNNDASRDRQAIIDVDRLSSDNQYRSLAGEKVISPAISSEQVNQDASEPRRPYRDSAEMKKADASSVQTTTSKPAADKNKGPTSECRQTATCSPVQLVDNKVARCKSENHERPEIKATQPMVLPCATGADNNDRSCRIDTLNKPIASLHGELELAVESSNAQAKQDRQQVNEAERTARAVAPGALVNTDEIGSDVDESGRRKGGNGARVPAADAEAAADAFADADEATALASLETIITNKPGARDVPPEANEEMLNRQIGLDANASSSVLPPLDNSVGDASDDAAKKVASQVDSSVHGREPKCTTMPPALRPDADEEIENDDQCGGDRQKRHFPERHVLQLVGMASARQHREQALLSDGQQYANPSLNSMISHGQGHHDRVNERRLQGDCEIEHPGRTNSADRYELIEPLYCESSKSLRSMQTMSGADDQQGQHRGTVEEDIRSSCSSSGFGASVSATSSSSSTESNSSSASSPQHNYHHTFRDKKAGIPTSFASSNGRRPKSMITDQIYDVVRPITERDATLRDHLSRKEYQLDSDTYKRLSVGPDQAYPASIKHERPLLIENHGYASLVNRCQLETNSSAASQLMDFYAERQYANLPYGRMPLQASSNVEYATVRANRTNGERQRLVASLENKRHSTTALLDTADCDGSGDGGGEPSRTSSGSSETDCDSSLSGRNNSLSSANSGGFSKLPPVRLIDHDFANTLDSRAPQAPAVGTGGQKESQPPLVGKKPSSLLKRFGSLVSRAFTAPSNSVANQSAVVNLEDEDEYSRVHSKPPPLPARTTPPSPLEVSEHELRDAAHNVYVEPMDDLRARAELAEADLVILPTKHNKKLECEQPHEHRKSRELPSQRNGFPVITSGSLKNHRSRRDEKLAPSADKPSARHRCRSKARRARLSRSISISSGNSGSLYSSLEYLSLISASGRNAKLTDKSAPRRTSLRLDKLRRASSLSDELESMMSPSEIESVRKYKRDRVGITNKRAMRGNPAGPSRDANLAQSTRGRISIDCVSPTGVPRIAATKYTVNKTTSSGGSASGKSHSLLRWFGNGTSSTNSVNNSTSPASPRADTNEKFAASTTDYRGVSYEVPSRKQQDSSSMKRKQDVADQGHRSLNGFLSLIDRNHASSDCKLDRLRSLAAKPGRKGVKESRDIDSPVAEAKEPTSLIYAQVNQNRSAQTLRTTGQHSLCALNESDDFEAERRLPSRQRDQSAEPMEENAGKCQSLNIYQSLMRNYVRKHHHHHHHHQTSKRSHARHAHHGHRHHHHHHHCHNNHASTNYHHKQHLEQQGQSCCQSDRHTCSSSARCGAQCTASSLQAPRHCVSLDYSANCSKSSSPTGKSCGDKSSVWGQLIKINKSDGSQVIELQRAPSMSWGFFVARGAINNIKGIFISRMHDSMTSSSLTGLLSIGDRILSIDNCPIGPDFDILRVNQMISKKSKIVLRVKPFKG